MRAATLLAPVVVSLLASGARGAERLQTPTLADRGGFVVSFERLLGYSTERIGRSRDTQPGDHHLGVGSLLGPRIGIYGVARGGFTAGGVVSTFFVQGEEGRVRGGVMLAGARLGWLFTNDVVGVWPRTGFTALVTGDADDLMLSYCLEVPLTVHLTQHAGLLLGPSAELPMSKTARSTYTAYAFSGGIFGAF